MLRISPRRLCFALALLAASPALAESISLSLAPGAVGEIALPENPSTGYVWRLDAQKSRNAGVARLDDLGFSAPEMKPGSPPLVGAPGVHKWALKALAPGRAKLLFALERPWENGTPPAETREVEARVK